jgi:hypothetical protein
MHVGNERGLPCSQRYVYMDRESGGCLLETASCVRTGHYLRLAFLELAHPHLPHSL